MNQDPNIEKDLFAEALELPPDQREGFLKGACRSDEQLRRRVEDLLRVHGDAGGILATEAKLPTIKLDLPDAPDETVGQTVGRYKLLEKLGEGGCGVVYVAEQTEPVRRRVALKVIKLGMDTKQVVARFEAERQALAMMDHPNIAKVLDAGTTETGRPYFVMELVRGIRITDYCDQSNLSTKERLDLFIKVCHAIQHAHQKGIIHRDIKPSNILVTLHDGVPVPKVIDFGIAKATEGRLTDATVYTQLHQFIGTPAYMSPEQAEMSGLDIDTRSDIYSLGVLLYELLAGSTPFDAKELMASGIDAMRKTIREKEPPRPSTRLTLELVAASRQSAADSGGEKAGARPKRRYGQMQELIHLLKGDLDWIVMKCLEKDRARRYDTANGLATDIQRHLNNEPVIARPPSTAYRFQKLVRRNKLAFAAAGAVAVALIAGMGFSTWSFLGERKALAGETAQRRTADEQRQRAEAAQIKETEQRQRAEANATRAEYANRELRQSLYAQDMMLAWRSLAEGDIERTRGLLRKYYSSAEQTNDLRTFEWRYLWGQSRPGELFILTNGSTMARYSPDGRMVATARWSGGGSVKLWDASSWKPLTSWDAYRGGCWGVAFSPDGKELATISRYDKDVKLWNADTGDLLGTLTRANQEGFWVSYSPDGKRLATVESTPYSTNIAAIIKIWDAASRRELFELKGERSWVTRAEFSPDSQVLATANGDGVVKIWDLEAGNEIKSMTVNRGFVLPVRFSPDGKILATADERGTIILWDWAAERVQRVLTGHRGPIDDLSISRDGQRLASAGRDFTARLWDFHTGQELEKFLGHSGRVWTIDFSPDGETLVTAGEDLTARFWRAVPNQQSEVFALRDDPNVGSIGFSPDGRYLFEDQWNRDLVTLKNPSSMAVLKTLPGSHIAFPADGKILGVVRNRNNIVLCETDTFREIKMIEGTNRITSLCFSHDKKFLVARRADRTIVFDLEQMGEAMDLGRTSGDPPMIFTPDSLNFITINYSHNNSVQVWDVPTWKTASVLNGHTGTVKCLAVSPDGRTLASSDDTTVRLWNVERSSAGYVLLGNKGKIMSIAFSRDGKILAASSWEGPITLWNVPTGQEVGALTGHLTWAKNLSFSPDGRSLLSHGYDRTMRLWKAPSFQEIAAAEQARAK